MVRIRFRARPLLALALLGLLAADGGPQLSLHHWTFLGPAPIFDLITPTTTRFSGRIDVAVADPRDPDVLYVGAGAGGTTAGGGVWKTTNWRSTNPIWEPLTDNLPSLSIFSKSLAFAPGPHGGILYAAAQGPNGGIMRSGDGGKHWKYLGQGLFSSAQFGAIAVSPTDSNTVYVATGGNTVHGLFRSNDGGMSWANVTDPTIGLGNASDVVIDPSDASVLYVGIENGSATGATNGGVYQSTDGGNSWNLMDLPLPSGFSVGSFIALRMAPSNPNYVYATVFGSNNSPQTPELQRFSTNDGGKTWNLLKLPDSGAKSMCSDLNIVTPQDFRFWHVVLGVDPTDPKVVYANACEPTFVVSTDGGSSWTELPTVDDVVNVFFDDSNDLVLTGDRGIHLSSNPLSMNPTFASKQGNLGNFLVYNLALDPMNASIIDAISQDQLSGIQYAGKRTWSYSAAGSEVGMFLINPNDDNLRYVWGFMESGIFIERSEDGGKSWSSQMNGLDPSDFEAKNNQTFFNAFALDPSNPSRLVLGGEHVWEAIDSDPSKPLTWNMLNQEPSPGNQITALAVGAGTNGQTAYAGTVGDQFFVTTNGGTSWSNITPPSANANQMTTAIVVDPNNPARLFINSESGSGTNWNLTGIVAPATGRIWMTTNGGASWSSLDGNLPSNLPVNALAVDFRSNKPKLFAGTARGVFRSRDLGRHWKILKTDLPNVTIDDLEFLPQTGVLAAATFGRGVWETVLP